MTPTIDNSLLAQTQAKTEASVPNEYKRGYHAIVAAGLKAMFSDKTFPMMKQYLASIKSPQDIPNVVAHGIIKLLSILYNESKGKMPLEASGPAAIMLMTNALDYVEDVMKIPIDAEILAQTTDRTNSGLMQFLKQTSGLNDGEFEKIMRGQSKELIAEKQSAGQAPGAAPAPQQGQPPLAAPPQGSM